MQRIGQLPPFYRISLYVSVACGAIIILMMLRGIMLPGIDNSIADKDFVNYWMAGKLLFDGELLDLFGPQPIYFSHLQAAFGEGFQWHNWSYPPHFLLLIWPLGLLGYKAAMVAFLVVTGGLYLVAYRAYVDGWSLLAWVATAPFLVLNLWCVQNGYLFGAIALGFMLLRDKRPIVSGALLALLTIKPQLGLLFPFLLIAERRWLVIAYTIASTALLIVLSAALFGIDSWRGYINEVLPYQTLVAANLSGLFLSMLCSPFGALRNWGMDATMALWIHAIIAVPVALITILAFFKVPDTRHRANIFFTATFLITPYALNYDLGTFSATVAVMIMADAAKKRQQQWRMVMYAMAMMLPILMMLLMPVRGSIAPFVIFAMWLVALNQAGFRISMPRRQEAGTPAAASS